MNKSAAKKMKQRSAGKPDIELGKRIRLRRVEQKISQAELGDKLGVSFQQVQKYEKGVNRVGAARLQQIATALDVPVTFFYDGDGKAREVESLLFLDSSFSLQAAARLQQDQGSDRSASAGVPDGIDRRERRLAQIRLSAGGCGASAAGRLGEPASRASVASSSRSRRVH